MECFKMYHIFLNLLFVAIKLSDAIDAEFEGIKPETVVVGSNVTFSWRYTGQKTPHIAELYVADTRLLYHAFGLGGTPDPHPEAIRKYATGVAWVGNASNHEFAFMLTGVKEFSHKKNFSLYIEYTDVLKDKFYTKDLLFISVRPKVQLRIDKTNVSVGDRVTIECQQLQKGRPTTKISWYHNNKLVPEKNELYLFNEKEIELKDAGTYRCIGKNNAGESKSEVKRITVNKKQNPDEENPTVGKSSGGLSGGAIAGVVIGVLIVIFIILVALLLFIKKRKNEPKSSKKSHTNGDETKSPMVSQPADRDQVWL